MRELAWLELNGEFETMAARASKPSVDPADLFLPLPPEGPELDALIREKIAEADADTRPRVPMKEAFDEIRARFASDVEKR
jgi:hypothetical protein